MKKKALLLLTSTCLLIPSFTAAAQKSVNQELLDLLKQKDIVTEQQYQKWTDQLTEEEKDKISLKYNKGLVIQPSESPFTLKVNGRLENDFIYFDRAHTDNNNFTVRRAWLTLNGTAYKYFGFKLQPDFTGSSHFQDATVEMTYSPKLKLRVGQFKTPFGLEWSIASKYRDFMFRSLPTINISPNRDRGAVIQGNLCKARVTYGIGILNGTRTGQGEVDRHKDIAGRIVLSPFQGSNQLLLKGLHFGGSATYGRQDTDITNNSATWWNQGYLQNVATGTRFFQFNNGVVHSGNRTRYGVETAWMIGPLTLSGEWMTVELNDLSFNNQHGDFEISGYYVALSYFITGEEQIFKNGQTKQPKPKANFDPEKNNWGAWQLVARIDAINIDSELLNKGYATATSYTDGAQTYTAGVNWYPNEFFRIMLHYAHTSYDDAILVSNTRLDEEDVIMSRFQFNF